MIDLQAIRIDQSYELTPSNATMRQYLVLLLPNGRELRAELTVEGVADFLQSLGTHPAPSPIEKAPIPQSPTPPPEPEMELTAEEEDAAENTPILWNDLDDQVLSPVMKAAFFKLRAPMAMTPKAIMALVEDIAEKFSPADWEEVVGPQPAPQPAPPPVAVPTQPTRVQWADGSPMMPGSVRGRTVPKDEMGYPIIEGEVDPGEVVGHGSDVDEDGVGQL